MIFGQQVRNDVLLRMVEKRKKGPKYHLRPYSTRPSIYKVKIFFPTKNLSLAFDQAFYNMIVYRPRTDRSNTFCYFKPGSTVHRLHPNKFSYEETSASYLGELTPIHTPTRQFCMQKHKKHINIRS
jgi:hypothetical protein